MTKPKIGDIGIATQEILKGQAGSAYFPNLKKEIEVKALEHIQKHAHIIIVEEPNKVKEYRPREPKPKSWNCYRKFTLSAAQEISPAIRIKGESTLLSIGIYVDGASADAAKTSVQVHHDKEKYPSLNIEVGWLKWLGGGLVPTRNPTGGMTVEDTSAHIYAGFINPNIEFRSECLISIKNGDPANPVTIHLFILCGLKQTLTEIFIKGGTEGGEGGEPITATEDSTTTVGGGAGQAALTR